MHVTSFIPELAPVSWIAGRSFVCVLTIDSVEVDMMFKFNVVNIHLKLEWD